MRLADETITVINSFLDEETGLDTYHASVIKGVSWFSRAVSVVDADANVGGLKVADEITIRIPVDADLGEKQVVEPWDYTDPETQICFKRGDIIVKGTLSASESLTPADVQRRHNMCTILTATDSTVRAPKGKHWRITGS